MTVDLSKLKESSKEKELNKIADSILQTLRENNLSVAEGRQVIIMADKKLAEKINNRMLLTKISHI